MPKKDVIFFLSPAKFLNSTSLASHSSTINLYWAFTTQWLLYSQLICSVRHYGLLPHNLVIAFSTNFIQELTGKNIIVILE